ncbi:MAG: Gfo/Idh/MocA family protein, partial [Bdellovibrionota bacterium]
RSLLAEESHHLDFVDIATPPSDHAQIAHAALERGLHVLCEKPLATSAQEAREMLEHAKAARRVIFPCHNYKHAPVVRAIAEIIQSGRIGTVHSVTLGTFRSTHAVGVPEWRPHWRREKRISGGGIAMDHGSHTFYLALDWMKSEPTSVTAKMAALVPGYDTEDFFTATVAFPTGLVSAHLTWTAGVRKVLYTVQGDLGAITVDDDELQIATKTKNAARWEVERRQIASHWMDASHKSWFNRLLDEFTRAIRDEDYVGREARQSYLCVQLIETAYRSARQNSVELPLARNLDDYLTGGRIT